MSDVLFPPGPPARSPAVTVRPVPRARSNLTLRSAGKGSRERRRCTTNRNRSDLRCARGRVLRGRRASASSCLIAVPLRVFGIHACSASCSAAAVVFTSRFSPSTLSRILTRGGTLDRPASAAAGSRNYRV